jgi:hypothetical protein
MNITQSLLGEIEDETNKQGKSVFGHDSDDQKKTPTTTQQQSRTISKFNGQGSPEQWLKSVMENIDVFELSEVEVSKLIPKILTGDALIWYIKHHEKINQLAEVATKNVR